MPRERSHSGRRSRAGAAETAGLSDVPPAPEDALEALFRERVGGAINVRGILFQILYSATRAVELSAATSNGDVPSVRFEGVEDLDATGAFELAPFYTPAEPSGDSGTSAVADGGSPPTLELVQVKTADVPWTWTRLRKVIRSFLEALRSGHRGLRFRIVTNFPLSGDLAELAAVRTLPAARASRIRRRFRDLCHEAGGTADEADALLERLQFETLSDAQVRARLRSAIAATFALGDSRAVDAHEVALVGQALTWARSRARVTLTDALDLGRRLQEGFERQATFEAYGRHWVERPSYAPDQSPDDFREAREARFGHVALGLDVPRPHWIDRITAALQASTVCIVRAPSGQGKSTLAMRYAYEHWAAESVVLVRSAGSEDEVRAVNAYVELRAGMGLPVRVMIDAHFGTRLWPHVAQACAALAIPTLITIRVEDWHRYAIESLTRFEIVEPSLGPDEAAGIFASLAARGRVHSSVEAAAHAYERIGEPHLLLEFVYLVTHGQMLEERLRDQVQAMRRLPDEDSAKVELLRRASLADALGAPVRLEALLDAVPTGGDAQQAVGSLLGEYLTLSDDGALCGLHWVRSEHLARVLHEGGVPPVTRTVLLTSALVPRAALGAFVANAVAWPGLDGDNFVTGLIDRYGGADPQTVIAIVNGLFEAGERRYFEANRARFEEAYALLGPSGVALVGYELAPMLPLHTLERMAPLAPEVDTPRRLLDIVGRVNRVPRGLDLARQFLLGVASRRSAVAVWTEAGTGRLLDWCALAGVRLPAWQAARESAVEGGSFDLSPDEFCAAALGLSRYDPAAYGAWYTRHESDVLAYLQLVTDSLTLDVVRTPGQSLDVAAVESPLAPVPDDEHVQTEAEPTPRVTITYAVEIGGVESPAAQSVRRLTVLRQALPFARRYDARGEPFLPDGVVLPHDASAKRMPRRNLPAPSDVAKNAAWNAIVSAAYYPDSYYRLLRAWYDARAAALDLLGRFAVGARKVLQGRAQSEARELAALNSAHDAFQAALRTLPRLTEADMARMGRPLPAAVQRLVREGAPNRWATSVENFVRMYARALNVEGGQPGNAARRLSISNLRDAFDALGPMHAAFATLFREAPDYHRSGALDARELQTYDELLLLLEGAIGDQPIPTPDRSPLRTIREREAQRERARVTRIAAALAPLSEMGINVVAPVATRRDGQLRETAIGVELEDSTAPASTLLAVVSALDSVTNEVDRVLLAPMRDGQRLGRGVYVFYTRRLRDAGLSADEDVVPDEAELQSVILMLSVPTEVTPDAGALLPPMAEVETPPAGFATMLAGLRADADAFARRANAVGAITARGEHPLLRELQRRHAVALGPLAAELREATARLRAALNGIGSPGSAAAREAAGEFLGIVDHLLDGARLPRDWDARWTVDRVLAVGDELQAEG